MFEDRKLARFSRQSSAGHFIFFYDNPSYKFNVLFNFLNAGLTRGESAIYHNAAESKRRLLHRMRKLGLDYDVFENRLVISNGSDISSLLESSLTNSKPGNLIRVVSNSQEYFYNQNRPSRIVKQEQILHNIASRGGVSLLCAYDSRWFNRPAWFRVFPPIMSLHTQAAFASAKGTVVMRELTTGTNRKIATNKL